MARYGFVDELITDNGPQFSCREFKEFSKLYEFTHNISSPLFSQSNGLAEKSVQTAKRLIEKAKIDHKDFHLALLDYCNTPRNDHIGSPAQRLMRRRTKTRLPTTYRGITPTGDLQYWANSEWTSTRQRHSKKVLWPRHKDTYKSKTRWCCSYGNSSGMETSWSWSRDIWTHPRSHIVKSGATRYRRNRRMVVKTGEHLPPQEYEHSDLVIPTEPTRLTTPTTPVQEQPGPIALPMVDWHPTMTSRSRVIHPPVRFKDFV